MRIYIYIYIYCRSMKMFMTNTKSIIVFAKCHKLDGKTVDGGMEFNVIGAIFLLFVGFGEKIDKPFSYEFSLYFCLQPLFTPRLVLNVTFGTLNSFLYEFTSHSMLFIYFFFSLFLSFSLFSLSFFSSLFSPFYWHPFHGTIAPLLEHRIYKPKSSADTGRIV